MPQYTNNIAITFPNIVGMANQTRQDSTAINNTVTQYDIVEISLKFKLGAAGVLSTGQVRIGVLGSSDGGATYDTNILPSNILETISGQPYISNGSQINTRVTLINVPQFWKLAVNNQSGAAFDGTGANFDAFFAGVDNFDAITVASAQTNVTSTATLLANLNLNRNAVVLKNMGADTIYLGPSSVAVGTGFPLASGVTLELPRLAGSSIYGIVASTTTLASVMQW